MVTGLARMALLLALIAILGPFVADALSKDDLYPYNGIGSSTLEVNDNGQVASVEVRLKTPISFYETIYDTVYVNGNGVLSFLAPMVRFLNIQFPLDYPIIAPLYTHVDIRGSGAIYWWETDAPNITSKVTETIRNYFKDTQDFYPSHVLLVTWKDVGYYNAKSDKVNTYQIAVSSNGSHSFVEFLYPEKSIQWIQADSHPGGLPDAKAQAGLQALDGRLVTLKGSGTDQIQNIDKWSNVNNPGQWVFRIGPIEESENVQQPDNLKDAPVNNEILSCITGATSCHSKAECVDYDAGFCCICKTGFFGNGKFCQQNDIPLRVVGKVSGFVNGETFPPKDLQCYVQTKDGRTYTAMSRVPEFVGARSQLLYNLGGVIGWLFAKPLEGTKNGYQITGGVFNITAEINFTNTTDKITIRSKYLGLDVFGQLKMQAEITGSLPYLDEDARIEYDDHEELYTKTQPGTIISQSSRYYRLIGEDGIEFPFTQSLVITYQRCDYAPENEGDDTVRLKFSRDLISYESKEKIIRFAMNTKVAPLEEEDPCIEGRSSCGDHSSCIVEADDYKCICNPGYQYLYDQNDIAHCVDVNECTSGTHACSLNAFCINNEGSHECQCVEGFDGDGRTCEKLPSCEDIACGDYADCNMVDGRPVCSCSWGTEPYDEGCIPIEEISCAEKVCSPFGYCTEDPKRRVAECTCETGYLGDGYVCEPELNPATTTESTEEPPTPQCTLDQCWCIPDGWEYQGDICIRVNQEYSSTTAAAEDSDENNKYDDELSPRPMPECLAEIGRCICPWGYDYDLRRDLCIPQPGYNHETMGPSGSRLLSCNAVNTCHPYAQCVYLSESEGGYQCQCHPGYEGDGYECKKFEVTCLDADICDPDASCKRELSTARCICNPGYEGDGTICLPIDPDECNLNTDCGPNEQCIYNENTSRYTCNCIPGYNAIDDHCVIADCSTNPDQCHLNAECTATINGSYTCSCIEGYAGDGVHECRLDHIGCNIINNCGVNAVCGYNQTSSSYACQCKSGYYGDGINCLPESSCKRDPSLCSEYATCVPAGEDRFTCFCNAGYTGDGADCRIIPQHESNFLIVNQGMAVQRIPFFPTSENPGSPISIIYTQLAIGIDIDCSAGRVYWSDIGGKLISSMTYNGSDSKILVTEVSSSEGLAIDWVSRNAFWTDSNKGTVEVANLDTQKRKVLVSEGLVNPRGIAAHPYRGKIFWSDWNRVAPKLEWSNEDGSGREIFIQNDYVKLPNSLAIDWSTDEICWADAGLSSINCANIDSRTIRVIVNNASYPFGLAISPNHYYWSDWKTHKIHVAAKNSGERTKPLDIPPGGGGELYGIVAVPEFCPRVSNVCQYEFGGCNAEQLCLPDGEGGRTCACADNASGPCKDEYQTR